MADDDLLLRGVSRAMAMICAALIDDDDAYRRRVVLRLQRAVKVCAEREERAPELRLTQQILQESLSLLEASGESAAHKRRR